MIYMWSTLCENAVWSQQAVQDPRFSQCQWQLFQIVCDHNRAAGISTEGRNSALDEVGLYAVSNEISMHRIYI